MLQVKRVYDSPNETDGYRILVDKLWPRGLTKEKAKIDLWLKDIAPSNALRKWFSHDPKKWQEFKSRYLKELKENEKLVSLIQDKVKETIVTLLFAAKDQKYNNAVVLKEHIESVRKIK